MSTKQPMPYGRNGICLLWYRAGSNCNYSLLINSSIGEPVREHINGNKHCSTGSSCNTREPQAATKFSPHAPAAPNTPQSPLAGAFLTPPEPHPAKESPLKHIDPASPVPQQERTPAPAPHSGTEQTQCKFPLHFNKQWGRKSNFLL